MLWSVQLFLYCELTHFGHSQTRITSQLLIRGMSGHYIPCGNGIKVQLKMHRNLLVSRIFNPDCGYSMSIIYHHINRSTEVSCAQDLWQDWMVGPGRIKINHVHGQVFICRRRTAVACCVKVQCCPGFCLAMAFHCHQTTQTIKWNCQYCGWNNTKPAI